MQIRNSDQAYGAAAQALHWATVLLVILAWTLGTFDDALPKGAARAAGLFVHISAGLVIPALLILRLLLRVVDPPPALEPTRLGKWAEVTARLAHYSMYALLIAVPVTGILAQFARGNPLPVFGLFEIASPWLRDKNFAHNVTEVHEVFADALLILAGLHASAALAHHWVLRDRNLLRMLPQSRAAVR
jgi:cytochrome b561